MECAEALRIAEGIKANKFYGASTCREVAITLERHYRRACKCHTRLADWPFNTKPADIDWDLFDD